MAREPCVQRTRRDDAFRDRTGQDPASLQEGSRVDAARFVYGPGGEIRIGRYLYFTTGDIIPVTSTGTIERYDLLTGSHYTRAKGLTMPNGLAFLPNGDAVVT